MDEFRETNLKNWESRVPVHVGALDYRFAAYAADRSLLSEQVAYDRDALGDLSGLDVVHVQCHIGTDTISLARLGARVTGVDFSPSALDAARELAASVGADASFVEAEVYSIPEVLGAEFDLVYTGVGAINWLPDIAGWARVVSGLLRPGGRLFIRDAHPMLMTIHDERDDDQLVVAHPYFEGDPLRWDVATTYVNDLPIAESVVYEWNHGLGEIVQAVIDAGLNVTAVREHDECAWRALPRMVEIEGGFWVLPEGRERLPMMFTLEARRSD